MAFPKRSLMVLAMTLATAPAWAADCAVEIHGDDAMKFDKAGISVPKACKEFTVTLKHVGKLPKTAMGHNWVLSRTADLQGVAADGIAAGLSNEYVKPGDARVIAFTKVVGPGESATVKFPAGKLKAGESYTYYCTFPGHSSIMKGSLKLAD